MFNKTSFFHRHVKTAHVYRIILALVYICTYTSPLCHAQNPAGQAPEPDPYTFTEFSPDGKLLLYVEKGHGELIDSESGRSLSSLLRDEIAGSVTFSPDSKMLCFSTSKAGQTTGIYLYDISTPTRPRQIAKLRNNGGTGSGTLSFSADASRFVLEHNKLVELRATATGKVITSLPLDEEVFIAILTRDEKTLVALTSKRPYDFGNMNIRRWDAVTGKSLQEPVKAPARISKLTPVSQDCDRAVITEGKQLRLWDTFSGTTVGEAAFISVDSTFIVSSSDGASILFQSAPGTLQIRRTADFALEKEIVSERGNIIFYRFTSDSKYILLCTQEGCMRLYNSATLEPVGDFRHIAGGAKFAYIIRNNSQIAILAYGSKAIVFMDLLSGRTISNMDIPANTDYITFNEDSSRLLVQLVMPSLLKETRLWNTLTGQRIPLQLRGPQKPEK
ncbi:MAG: WD40 repeat domain-containing protein [Candidatus Methylacidiphilales bacterium]|nr:WD40 repeat domain-containing protein [Candidatus Methylacidiphilales bacterium]